MRKRKMLLGALLLGIAIIAGSNGITVEAATGKYMSPLEISEALKAAGRTMDNIVNSSSEWRYGDRVVNGKSYKTLTLAQKYCFNRITGQAAPIIDNDDVGDIVFNGTNGIADNTKYTIDTSKVGNGYHEYRKILPNGAEVPVGYWKNYGLIYAIHGEGFDAEDDTLGAGGYYDTTKWGTWANYHGVDFHAYSKPNKYPLVAPNEQNTKCFNKQINNFNRNSTAWIGYCAICGEKINPGLHYAPASAMKELSVVRFGAEEVFTCPTCGGMEGTSVYIHQCKAISANRYYVAYDDGTDDPNVTGNTNTSTFYYNFADEYEGKTIKSQDKKLAECGFVREGYTFAGWSTTKDGTVDYQPGTTLKLFQDPKVDNKVTTLYAVWTPNHSYVSVDANTNIFNGGAKYNGETVYFRKDTYQVLNNNNPGDPAAPNFIKSTYTIDTTKITLPAGYTVSFKSEGTTPDPITAETAFSGYNFKNSGANGWFQASSATYTYGSEERDQSNPDVITLQFTQNAIILPSSSVYNKSFIGWYDGPGDDSKYVGTTGDEYYPSKDITLYAKFSQMKIDVKSTYFREHDYKNDADEFTNIALNKLKNANNAAYDANHTYGRWNGTGAVNMQIGTFTNTKDEYVYKTFYRVKGTTEWTEINTSDGSSGAPRDEYPPINYGDWDDPNHPENGKSIPITNSGFYRLTAIGAQGGNMPNGKSGGKGGKTEAIYYLKKGDVLHIWVGGQGYSDGTGGFNGGGTGEKNYGAGGGGATTVVLERDGNQTTLMIAGGGGGATTLCDGGSSVNIE